LPQSLQAKADIFITSHVLADMPKLGLGYAARDFLDDMVAAWERQQASAGAGRNKLLMWVDRFDVRHLRNFGSVVPRGDYAMAEIPGKKTCMGGEDQRSPLMQYLQHVTDNA
jgi:hypothetical protein